MPSLIETIQQYKQDDIIIAFMGPTGTGKSTFIDLLTGEEGQRSGHSLRSWTAKIQATRVKHPNTGVDNIVLVDTPGFDDTDRSDVEILAMISAWLEQTYKKKIMLSGLVYLHAITDARMTGTAYKNLRTFASICGDTAGSRIVLVSTKWEDVTKPEIAEGREAELKQEFWRPFTDNGTRVERMRQSNGPEAWRIIADLIQTHKEREVLLLQEELVELQCKLNETAAGKSLYKTIQEQLAQRNTAISSLASRARSTNDPHMKEVFEREYNKSIKQVKKTFHEVTKLKIPLGRRIHLLFFGKQTRSKAIKIKARIR